MDLPSSFSNTDSLISKKISSRRNSRREPISSSSSSSSSSDSDSDSASSTSLTSLAIISTTPIFDKTSEPTKPSSLNDDFSFDKSTNKALTGPSPTSSTSSSSSSSSINVDIYILEKKALQTAEKAHAEHDAQLLSLENGPYLLGHYLLYVSMLAYYFLFLAIGFIAYIWHFSVDPDAMAILARNPATNKVSPSFFSAFFSVGMFTNTGFHLLPDNMIQLGSDRFTIIVSSVLATLGFSLYPLGLRVFVMMICAGSSGRYKVALRDILDNPRRYYTHLFSEKGTWAATLMSLSMTGLLFAFFLIFNFPDTYFKTMFPQPDIRAMNGWYESNMVYNNGYNTFDLSMMDVGSQVWMMLCMWATGRPFTLGILVTASESSISSDDSDGVDDIDSSAGSAWTVLRELLMLLRSDLIILVICTLMICMYDNALLVSGIFTGPNTSIGTGSYIGVFPIAFDLSSAYGNVGLSLGYPNTVTSSCAVLSSFGKLVVIFMSMHGYCMGIFPSSVSALELPYGVEEAVFEEQDGPNLTDNDFINNDINLLKTGSLFTDAMNRTQILQLCELTLQKLLAKESRSSTGALTSTQVNAGASAESVVSQLSDEGRQAFCSLILKRHLHSLISLENLYSKQIIDRYNTTTTKDENLTLRSRKKRDNGAALESLFADNAPNQSHSLKSVGSPKSSSSSSSSSGLVIGRRGGQVSPRKRTGGRGT